jgi:membrane protein
MSTSAQRLEHEAERQGQQLATTLQDVRAALAPNHIAAELVETTRSGSFLQRNALPIALLASGALWMAASRKKKQSIPLAPEPHASGARSWLLSALVSVLTHSVQAQQHTQPAEALPPAGLFPPSCEAPRQSESSNTAVTEGAGGEDRGRYAQSPSEIPARGWWDILVRVFNNISAHRVLAIAAGVTYYSLLALFPAIASIVSLYGLFADSTTIATHLSDLESFMPGGALEVVRDQITRVASQGNRTLGLTFAIGLATSLWSANAGMKAFFDALNIIYGEVEKRGFFKLNALSLAFTFGAIAFMLVALAAIVVIPLVLSYIGFASGFQTTFQTLLPLLRWPALFMVITLALAVLYRYGPSRKEAKWHWITWGSAAASFVWLGASILFSWYTANFGSYNATYGSLGAVIGFMIWIWLSSIVFLLGAELDSEMEHQTLCDTTDGRPSPLGQRGAQVADTVGAAQRS